MTRNPGIFCLFFLLFSVYSQEADAQFWKKIFGGGDSKRKERKEKEPEKDREPVVKVDTKTKRDGLYPPTTMKTRYRVDVLMPLYLHELVVDGKIVPKGKLPEKVNAGLDFYEGVKLAADTLSSFGYNIDVYIHDITDPAHRPAVLKSQGKLDSSDLIIGVVQSEHIPLLAGYARERQINFVSALSPSDANIKSNPYYLLMQPGLQTHCRAIRARVEKKHRNADPVLYYRTNVSVDKEAYGHLKQANRIDYRELLCNTMPGRNKLAPLFDSTQTNVVVMAILDNEYADTLLKQLYFEFPGYRFEVFGMPSWRSLYSIRQQDAYPNVTVNITSPYFFDLTTASGQALAKAYKKEFGGSRPGELVYRGYETMYWFAYLLKKYGTIFNPKLQDSGPAPFTRYDIQPRKDEDGDVRYLENQHVYHYRYQSGSWSIDY